MEASTAEQWLQWTIRGSLLLAYSRWLYRLWSPRAITASPSRLDCWLWGFAFGLFAVHICLSFHWVHNWRHTDAWLQTATETEAVVGIRRGDGIWANYAMIAIWAFDLVRLCSATRQHRPTSHAVDWSIGLFFGFMFFNATVVFGPSFYQYLFVPAMMMAAYCWHGGKSRQIQSFADS
ncbi:MAG: hypothetical protein OSA98_21305 [Rubripirellula sp.]|nr:hypothetical protein [Rubripirellula sp.]